jgi:hypothetical protein
MMPCQDREERRTLDIRHRRSAVISFSARQIQRTTSGDVELVSSMEMHWPVPERVGLRQAGSNSSAGDQSSGNSGIS